MADILARMQIRRGTAAQWAAVNPVLRSGEFGYETDTKRMRCGDGVSPFASLPIFVSTGDAVIGALLDVAGKAGQVPVVFTDVSGTRYQHRTPQQFRESNLGISGPGGSAALVITNPSAQSVGGTFFIASFTVGGSHTAEPCSLRHEPADTTDRAWQELVGLTSGRRWQRVETGATWGAWVEVQTKATIDARFTVSAAAPGAGVGQDGDFWYQV